MIVLKIHNFWQFFLKYDKMQLKHVFKMFLLFVSTNENILQAE